MKLVYFISPVIALVIFSFFYVNAKEHYAAEEAAQIVQARADNIARLKQDAADRKQAVADAVAQSEARKALKATKAAADLARKESRQAAIDALDLSNAERKRLRDRSATLERDIQGVEGEIKKIEADNTRLTEEAAFLRSYVTIAKSTEKEFVEVIQDIKKAEKAHAAALIAAANADKK